MKLQVTTMAALLCAMSASVSAREIELSLSNDTALLRYSTPVSYNSAGRTDADLGLLYTNANDYLGMAGIAMIGEAGSQVPGLYGGVGIRAYGASLDRGADIGAIALGGSLKYVPPTMNRLGLVGAINYAPDITSFGDATRFWHLMARVEYEVLPAASVFVGFRDVSTRLGGVSHDVHLDKGLNVGMKMSF